MEGHHYFYALLLPQSIKEYLREKCDEIKCDFPFIRWVHQEDYHITLAFLGHATKEQLERADEYIQNAIYTAESFPLCLNEFGVFGRQESPRIFWANTFSSDSLNKLRKEVYDACVKTGFQLDPRPFKPHITLARNWSGEDRFQLEQLKQRLSVRQDFIAQYIVLYETHLDKTPKYVIKKKYKLLETAVGKGKD
ncbi:RNA 2',3'-cyclic phosphodiesterase [Bacillus sp. FJAT-49736]|uniref:RNA 2',3'-cyclic phosphodiesterase n=1 Tax=Bacillus sp. FJAT-49736 TaxID=2833582 RepID=UPI001BC91D3B|nr:RNA 2',3'-cyclic phosphodiesterase [Bacillus sp. FJAT-49736]MBS4173866.1 RNA 2',3'-cyclic phosphodiesterase [Bacillus sp. FJAT-49736]